MTGLDIGWVTPSEKSTICVIYILPKEYDVASSLSERFYLFVVKNFRDLPMHDIYRNPLSSSLKFTRKERVVVQVSWSTTI